MKINQKYYFLPRIIPIIFISFYSTKVFSGRLDIDFSGLSYHIGLDKNKAFAFNPGLGLGYDFRLSKKKRGCSLIMKGIYFQKSNIKENDTGFVFIFGLGARYRYMLLKHWSIDGNSLIMYSNQALGGIFPMFFLSNNYHFKNDITLGLNLILLSRKTIVGFSSRTWTVFTMLQFSFPIH